MTRERIAEGLELLTLQLASSNILVPPEGWDLEAWATLKGIAIQAIWMTRSRFVIAGQA